MVGVSLATVPLLCVDVVAQENDALPRLENVSCSDAAAKLRCRRWGTGASRVADGAAGRARVQRRAQAGRRRRSVRSRRRRARIETFVSFVDFGTHRSARAAVRAPA